MSFFEMLTAKKKSVFDNSFYEFELDLLEGGTINFQTFRGKKVLLVNTAAQCGFSSQLYEMERIYQKYKDNLIVLAVPSNTFMGQEPGNRAHLRKEYREEFKVTFPITHKLIVKGDGTHPLYRWIENKKLDEKYFAPIKWNFHKYLFNENGEIIGSFSSSVLPNDRAIISKIEQ